MKILRNVALVLTIVVSALTIGLLAPQLANDFPILKSFANKVRSVITPARSEKPSGLVVVVGVAPGSQLNANEVRFLEHHKRRHDLLHDALQ